MPLLFGIYPGGLGAAEDGSTTPGPAEDPARITEALDDLHGTHPFLVRGYLHYSDASPGHPQAPPSPAQYATGSRRLDLVLCFREPGENLDGWLAFVRDQVRAHAGCLATVQIAEEADHAGPGGDGGFPAVRAALVAGVVEAKREILRLGIDAKVGCNSTVIFDPAQEFWTDLGQRDGFRESLDYAGLDFFPDVFAPIPPGDLASAVTGVLTMFRQRSLAAAGLAESVPIHITEHGWGTGDDRPHGRQAEVVETVVRRVAQASQDLNIAAYEHFALRDADSSAANPLFQLGLTTSAYVRKPAFDTYRALIDELSV
ncbi:hypothetical protein [Actinoplanes sp. NPDC023714]|uniref:hypothetical protein n=1 Tax=Actinoplanes sp. NPDC023714 TaxID=3154322 RepID=UPI00340A6222